LVVAERHAVGLWQHVAIALLAALDAAVATRGRETNAVVAERDLTVARIAAGQLRESRARHYLLGGDAGVMDLVTLRARWTDAIAALNGRRAHAARQRQKHPEHPHQTECI
jgi:hypothetical protein